MSVARDEARLALVLLVELLRVAGNEDDDEPQATTARPATSRTDSPTAVPITRPRQPVVA